MCCFRGIYKFILPRVICLCSSVVKIMSPLLSRNIFPFQSKSASQSGSRMVQCAQAPFVNPESCRSLLFNTPAVHGVMLDSPHHPTRIRAKESALKCNVSNAWSALWSTDSCFLSEYLSVCLFIHPSSCLNLSTSTHSTGLDYLEILWHSFLPS